MKLKDGFVIRCIADEYMMIPVGNTMQDFSGVVVLNEVSAFILEHMQNPISKEDLLDLIVAEYDVAPEIAEKDLGVLIEKFQGYGMIE